MTRLVAAVAALGFVLAMAGAMASAGRWLAALLLGLAGVALLVGALMNPMKTALATIAVVAIGLGVGGSPMEGVGILLVFAGIVYARAGTE